MIKQEVQYVTLDMTFVSAVRIHLWGCKQNFKPFLAWMHSREMFFAFLYHNKKIFFCRKVPLSIIYEAGVCGGGYDVILKRKEIRQTKAISSASRYSSAATVSSLFFEKKKKNVVGLSGIFREKIH